jgi:hypothetical protein
MKKMLMAVLMLGMVGIAGAQSDVDLTLGNAWQMLFQSDNFHLLDNATPMVAKSLQRHVWYTGVGTTFYTYKYLNVDFQALRVSSASSNFYPAIGANLMIGRFLYDDLPFVKTAVDSIGKSAPMISTGTLGLGYTRDFNTGRNVPFVFGGIVSKFGQGGK